MSTQKLETVKRGKEGFKARCYILQQTTQPDIFRLTDKILLYEDLSCFGYSVPYYFKDELGLIKIEYNSNNRRGFAERTSKRRREDFSDEDLSDKELSLQ